LTTTAVASFIINTLSVKEWEATSERYSQMYLSPANSTYGVRLYYKKRLI